MDSHKQVQAVADLLMITYGTKFEDMLMIWIIWIWFFKMKEDNEGKLCTHMSKQNSNRFVDDCLGWPNKI